MRRHRPAVVVSWLFDAAVATFLAGPARRGIGWVATLHNAEYEPEAIERGAVPHAKVRALLAIDRTQVRWSQATFVAVSNSVARSAGRHLRIPTDRIKIVPNCVDPEDLVVADREAAHWRSALGIPPGGTIVLSVGRLQRQKNYHSLIDAFAEVAGPRPDAHLVLIGSGPDREDLAVHALRVALEGRIHLPGMMSQVGIAYAAADVFAFPSLSEGFGIALVEAMWSALPVIASRIPALEELVEDGRTGLLVRSGPHDGLSDALGRLLDDVTLRQRLGQAGAITARRFSPSAVVPMWHELWDSFGPASAPSGST